MSGAPGEQPPLPPSAPAQRPPVPQFGEYASPEEQQRRIQANPRPAPPAPPAASAPASAAPRASRGIDRIVTIGLLVYGLISTVTSLPQMADYAAYAENLLRIMGIDATLSDPGGARGWGLAAAIVTGLGWIITAALSYLWMRAGRLSFWIPLAGALVFLSVSGVLLAIPLLGDPAVLDAL